ncbi:MAG: 3-hydroxyacyl-CoA dehydrogenase [Ectothiorhodospiraceae bacterium]|nr:3-hydroxyacyl-CoA dehydrogenase [Chromatiales bacterium]MCP5157653.1 3-hydroxyacyl-CoA dehydrogenase [Ectothiorhodospiraceae bacterium]
MTGQSSALTDPGAVRRVSIIGTGTIGASWAAHFLAYGMDVRAYDPAPDAERRLQAYIDEAWPALERLGLRPGADRGRLTFCSEVAAALEDAEFVQENAPERMDVKRALYAQFDDALPPGAVMSTSTSGLLMSELQAGRRGRERYVLGHPFNPPHLIPLVEVLGGRDTAPEVVDWTLAFYDAHGKKAIRLNREQPGHLANRLQAAVWREAVDAVVTGLASMEDVDRAIAYGPGLRWGIMGPHTIFHLAGGKGGMPAFMDHFGPGIERWWADMRPVSLTPEVKRKLLEAIGEATHGRGIEALEHERDTLLVAVLETLARTRAQLADENG